MQTKPLLKKGLAIGIILLFIGTAIIPSTAQNIEKSSSRGNWLYVGGSGPGNYTRIQDAINASYNGDTVFVYDDSSPYVENIFVNVSISLVGEEKNTTIIDGAGNGSGITINANNVTILGFTIQNYRNGAAIFLTSNNSYISDNIITKCISGIYLASSHNRIIRNVISKCDDGTQLYGTDNYYGGNKIMECFFAFDIDSFNTTIERNSIVKNIFGFQQEKGADHIYFIENNFINNIIKGYFVDSQCYFKNNYWNRPRLLPKLIFGMQIYYNLFLPHPLKFPWVYVDWHPAQKPYDIPEVR
jgi:parallel beta-helix repeat protein